MLPLVEGAVHPDTLYHVQSIRIRIMYKVRIPLKVSSFTMGDLLPGIRHSRKDFNNKGHLALKHYDHGFAFEAKVNGKNW